VFTISPSSRSAEVEREPGLAGRRGPDDRHDRRRRRGARRARHAVSLAAIGADSGSGLLWCHGGDREDEFDEDLGPDDPTYEPAPPYWFPGTRMPDEAPPDRAHPSRAGRRSPRLRGPARLHADLPPGGRLVMLVVFGLPVVFYVIRLVQDLGVR
jgi:hypothetical protein